MTLFSVKNFGAILIYRRLVTLTAIGAKEENGLKILTETLLVKKNELEKAKSEQEQTKQYVVNDVTLEKVQEILSDNPNGVLVFRDELVGWLAGLEKYGQQSDRSFYLESWNGDNAYTCERIQRGRTYIPYLCLCIFGGIQPEKLKEYLKSSFVIGANDGFIQRFQMMVYPDEPIYEYVDEYPDDEAYNRLEKIVRFIDKGTYETFGAMQRPDKGTACIRFDSEAQKHFVNWLTSLEVRLRVQDEPLILQHLAKYRKLMPALALLFHLIDVADGKVLPFGKVQVKSVQMAQHWVEYLESHARRIYGLLDSVSVSSAKLLLEKICLGKLGSRFRLTHVYKRGWSGLNTKEAAQDACEVLEAHHYIQHKASDYSDGGRPSTDYFVNPEVLNQGPTKPAS